MKLSRTELLAKVDAQIADNGVRHANKAKEALDAYNENLKKWRDTAANRLAANLRELANDAKKGKPVTYDDIREATGEGFRSMSLYFTYGKRAPEVKPTPYTPSSDLTSLKAFLEASTDDEINTSTLTALGWRNIANILR